MNTECVTNPEFGCACAASDARLCFELRYPNRNLVDIYEPYEKCGCICHSELEKDESDCDCHDCNDGRVV